MSFEVSTPMASFDYLENMYDVKLRPRLLRLLTEEYLTVTGQNDAVPTPPVFTYVVNAIKNFALLSESFTELTDSKLVQDWKSSVDAWVDGLLYLVSGDSLVDCWLGTSLLGVTCLECSCHRFLVSYSGWLDKLLQNIRPPKASESVKAASCASISYLFTRLGGYPNVKREGIAHAGKFIHPVLNILIEDGSEALMERAVGLLCTIITFFPLSIHSDYETVEAAIVSKIISGRYSVNTLKKYAHCLALLPRSRGDEDSWSLMMQKLLISINLDLTAAFRGLKEETDPSAALASLSEASGQSFKTQTSQLLTNRVPTLMLCCCTMLTTPYPAQVTVPVGPLLAVVWRVLMVDGSLYQPLSSFTTVMKQELTCCELPILHFYSLDLLAAVLKGVSRQLWPHTAEIVRILTAYFRRCALAALRIKVYSVIRILLMSMGVGIALSIDQDIISNAFVDLEYVENETGRISSSADSETSSKTLQQPTSQKRKHVTVKLEDEAGLEAEATKNILNSPISLKIAALQTLEVLLNVGGGLSSEYWQSSVDFLLVTVATNVCNGELVSEKVSDLVPADECSSTWADFQLAALRALLASLLSRTRVHPPYLHRGIELFYKGKQGETKIAEFCAHALLALEVLMHPRQLPTVEFPPTNEWFNHKNSENICLGDQKNDALLRTPLVTDNSDGDSDLHETWVCDGNETEASPNISDDNIKSEEPSEPDFLQVIEDFQAENIPLDGLSSAIAPEEVQHGHAHRQTRAISNSQSTEDIKVCADSSAGF
ncbi:uncharacterized protein LOC132315897 [Cornus florida]|uniref:uncharacterized protein LOC132315897 n=1 Tax=Cornus florida TaxID=4283 RepID=UPI0028971586|nr:uncharacterized protein LOC132315897 [Cornus florida]